MEMGYGEIQKRKLKRYLWTTSKKIFTSSNLVKVEDFLMDMDRRVSDEMNITLDKPFLENEIKMAVDQMHPHKSPGLDGMTTCFYQRYWSYL